MKNSEHTCAARFEELVIVTLFALKWIVLASVTGAVAGAGISYFLQLLHWGTEMAHRVSLWWVALPVAGMISSMLITYVSPEAYGHGTEAVIRAVNRGKGTMPFLSAPVKAITTVLCVSFGASAGKEGPSAQIGAVLASDVGGLLRLSDVDRRMLAQSGLAAGFAVVTGAPVAGVLFSMEALRMGRPTYAGLMPAVVSTLSAILAARWTGYWHPLHATFSLPNLDAVAILKLAAMAVFFGLVAWLYIEAEHAAAHAFHRIHYLPARTFVGGIVLVLLALAFSRDYLGLGVEIYERALLGDRIHWSAFLLKIAFVAVTLGSGFSGGAMTPVFVIGAAAGSALSGVLGFDPAFAAALGIVGVLAGAANTPLAAVALGAEAFGAGISPFAAVVAGIAYVVSGHRSINETQLLGQPKTPAFIVDPSETCENANGVRLAEPPGKGLFWIREQVGLLGNSDKS